MITLLSLLVSLLLIAMAHEGGHWVAARLNTVTVPLVHIGVGPHLVQFEAFGTRWRLGLLPLGGYTRVHGMLNSDARVPVQGDYRLLLPLQQGFIVAGGPVGNLFAACVLMATLAVADGLPWPEVLRTALQAPAYIVHGLVVLWSNGLGLELDGPQLSRFDGTWRGFVGALAAGNVIVGLVNLLPSPVTDGGRLLNLILRK